MRVVSFIVRYSQSASDATLDIFYFIQVLHQFSCDNLTHTCLKRNTLQIDVPFADLNRQLSVVRIVITRPELPPTEQQ